eukprot:TRINITY_DN29_c1_g2_i2.p1 TRINITY_DN29_c1_g2~~TRINITY_DN29_c1_g2_i2.p1  ORF type:complete len:273 (+),score=58.73 TRINITY_DN29_c1_g2_i2:426-1244(+)
MNTSRSFALAMRFIKLRSGAVVSLSSVFLFFFFVALLVVFPLSVCPFRVFCSFFVALLVVFLLSVFCFFFTLPSLFVSPFALLVFFRVSVVFPMIFLFFAALLVEFPLFVFCFFFVALFFPPFAAGFLFAVGGDEALPSPSSSSSSTSSSSSSSISAVLPRVESFGDLEQDASERTEQTKGKQVVMDAANSRVQDKTVLSQQDEGEEKIGQRQVRSVIPETLGNGGEENGGAQQIQMQEIVELRVPNGLVGRDEEDDEKVEEGGREVEVEVE